MRQAINQDNIGALKPLLVIGWARLMAIGTATALSLVSSCDCGGEKAFSYDFSPSVGDTWYYRELEDSAANYIDTVINVGITDYKGIPAWLLFSTHAGDSAQHETTTAFFRRDTFYHYSRTNGFFPETINYNGDIFVCTFEHPYMEIAWLPRYLDLGDNWEVATEEGKIKRLSDGHEYELTATVVAVFDSVENLSFNDTVYGYGELNYTECIRVVYTGKLEFEGIPIDLTIGKTWWMSGPGAVKQYAYATDSAGNYDPLDMYLLDYTGD
ncbi:MAG: hypothetical protein ACPL68_02075 [Candidatus Hydrothermia bacterium]